jgi:hypothetical protein
VKGSIKSNLEHYIGQLLNGKAKWPYPNTTVESPVRVKEPSAPVNPVKEAKKTAKPEPKPTPKAAPKPAPAANVKLDEEYETARDLLKAIDKGGVPLNPVKLNNVGRALGLDISRSAKPEDTVERIRAAVQRAIESAQAQAKAAAPKKVKITVGEDADDDEVPHGHVRYGGGLIEPDELEFDDDISGLVDLPVDESWSSEIDSNARRTKRPDQVVAEEDDSYLIPIDPSVPIRKRPH